MKSTVLGSKIYEFYGFRVQIQKCPINFDPGTIDFSEFCDVLKLNLQTNVVFDTSNSWWNLVTLIVTNTDSGYVFSAKTLDFVRDAFT